MEEEHKAGRDEVGVGKNDARLGELAKGASKEPCGLRSASREDKARELKKDFRYSERSQLVLDRRGRVARCGGETIRRQSTPADPRLFHRSHGDSCQACDVSSLMNLNGSMTTQRRICASSARLPRQQAITAR